MFFDSGPLIAKDDTGKQYVVNGNDSASYNQFMNQIESASASGRRITLDQSTAQRVGQYDSSFFSRL